MKHHQLLEQQLNSLLSDSDEDASSPEQSAVKNERSEDTQLKPEELATPIEQATKELINRNRELEKQLSELEQVKNALQESHSLLHASLNSTYEAIFVLDLEGNVLLTNPSFSKMFAMSAEAPKLDSFNCFMELARSSVNSPGLLINTIQNSLDNPEHKSECEFKTTKGRIIEAYSSPQLKDSNIVGQVWSFIDITELKQKEARHRAYHDLLTGLPNRKLLSVSLNRALSDANGNHDHVAVLYVDLDGFKDVNDSLGHRVGDVLLREITNRLESHLPKNAMLARHGGDEFIVVMENQTDVNQAVKLSTEILESFSHSFILSEEEISMSASIGISMSPEHGENPDKLIVNADTAMQHAKERGKNTFEVFHANKDSHTSLRLKTRNEINIALEQKQFELFFQPKVSLETGSIKGAEALIRWRISENEYRSPMDFIPLAEENGQIIPISQWVIRRACKYLKAWEPFLDDDFVLALNISAKHFQRGLLTEDMADAMTEMDVCASKLELEVTETAIMGDITLAVQTLNDLRKLGIRTAIDDFGTGYSSLSYLRKLPIEILKIDKSFIDEILTSVEDRTLVRGVIDMVHALGIEVVAEGVENHRTAELLREMKCDLVQGYHYCRPIPENEFLELIKNQQCFI